MTSQAAGGRFTAAEQVDIETVSAALRAAEQKLAHVEVAAPQAALRLHTGKPDDGDAELLGRLPELRQQVDTLRLALAGARQAEANREAKKRAEANAARDRSLCRQLADLQRDILAVASAAEALVKANDRVNAHSRAIVALLPPHIRAQAFVEPAVHATTWRQRVEVELIRLARLAGVENPIRPVTTLPFENRSGRIETLVEYASRVANSIKSQLKSPSVASVPAEDAGASVATPSVEAPAPLIPSTDGAPEPPAEVPVTLEAPVRSSPEHPLNVIRIGEVA